MNNKIDYALYVISNYKFIIMKRSYILPFIICISFVIYACNEHSNAMNHRIAHIGPTKNYKELPANIELSRFEFKTKMNCVSKDNRGHYWIASAGNGLMRFDGKNFVSVENSLELIGRDIQSIVSDDQGNVWIASDKGVCFYNGLVLMNFSDRTGIKNKGAFCGFKDSKGNLWFGAYKGYFKYDKQGFRYVELENVLTNKMDREYSVSSITEDRDGNIWLGTHGAGLCKFDGEKYEYYNEQKLDKSSILGIAQDSKGLIWIGTSKHGLLKYDGRKFEKVKFQVQEENKEEEIQISAVSLDVDGDVFIGSENVGLWKTNTSNVIPIDTTRKNIRSIYVSDSNKVWVCMRPEGC